MNKKYYQAIIGVVGLTALGGAEGQNLYGALAGFGAGCVVAISFALDEN